MLSPTPCFSKCESRSNFVTTSNVSRHQSRRDVALFTISRPASRFRQRPPTRHAACVTGLAADRLLKISCHYIGRPARRRERVTFGQEVGITSHGHAHAAYNSPSCFTSTPALRRRCPMRMPTSAAHMPRHFDDRARFSATPVNYTIAVNRGAGLLDYAAARHRLSSEAD